MGVPKPKSRKPVYCCPRDRRPPNFAIPTLDDSWMTSCRVIQPPPCTSVISRPATCQAPWPVSTESDRAASPWDSRAAAVKGLTVDPGS